MEKFYDVLDKENGHAVIAAYIERIIKLRSIKVKDPIGKIKAEIMCNAPLWGDVSDSTIKVIDLYSSLEIEDQRKVDMTIRDLIDHYKIEDMIDTNNSIDKVLDDYIEFRVTLDTVTPESSEEIEKILEMSDEEYEAYQQAQDDALEAQLEKASEEYSDDQ